MNVTPLRPVPLKPNPSLVRSLEDLLAKAQTGELTGLLGVATLHDGSLITTLKCADHLWLMLGAVEALKLQVGHQMAKASDE